MDEHTLQALPEELAWSGPPQKDDLAKLPGCPAVYLLLDEAGTPVQLAATQQLRRLALARLLEPPEPHRGRANLNEVVRAVRWHRVYSAFEGRWWYYRLARAMYPQHHLHLISFGPAWFLEVDWRQHVPEISLTKNIWQDENVECVGPWLTHDSGQQALEWLWGLFDLCRYPEQVRRAPEGTSCAYAEMDRCDAPCDGSAPLERYVERCRAAWEFTCGAVRPWIDAAKHRMKAAADSQQFEQAGRIKKQLAAAWKWHDNWLPLTRPAEELNYLLAIPVTRRRSWRLFLFRRGHLDEGPILTDRQLPKSAGSWLQERLSRAPEATDTPVRTEQTWLVAHFLKSKEGDASLIRALPTLEVPSDLEDELRALLAERRSRPPDGPETTDAPA